MKESPYNLGSIIPSIQQITSVLVTAHVVVCVFKLPKKTACLLYILYGRGMPNEIQLAENGCDQLPMLQMLAANGNLIRLIRPYQKQAYLTLHKTTGSVLSQKLTAFPVAGFKAKLE